MKYKYFKHRIIEYKEGLLGLYTSYAITKREEKKFLFFNYLGKHILIIKEMTISECNMYIRTNKIEITGDIIEHKRY